MNKLFYLNAATNSSEAIPIGNGRMGAMLYSGVSKDVYTLNDDTLWSGYPRDRNNPMASSALNDVKKLACEGKYLQAQSAAEQRMYGNWGQCYLPAGTLTVITDDEKFSDYKRELSLDDALHKVHYVSSGMPRSREAFASNTDDIICIRYSGKDLSLRVTLESKLKSSVSTSDGMLILEGEAPGDGVPQYIKAKQHIRYSDIDALKGMTYTIAVSVKSSDGKITALSDSIYISNATQAEIRLSVKTSFSGYNKHPYLEGIDHRSACISILKKSYEFTYDMLKQRHIDDYSKLYNRLQFNLGDGCDDMPTDERLATHAEHTEDLSFYELMYQYGRYLLISCSREGTQPANLQGIWNDQLSAPWSCNYTTNINVQMNYWGALGANLAECCDPLNEMINELKTVGENTAREHYLAKGFCVHHNTDLWRITQPMGAWSAGSTRYAFFPLAGAWLTRHLYEYYLYTLDKDFLKNKAYDAIKGIGGVL